MTFPNPLASVSELVARAFAIVGDRDGIDGRRPFGVELSRLRSRRQTQSPAPHRAAASPLDGVESGATSAEKPRPSY